jgi:hypothetical protein
VSLPKFLPCGGALNYYGQSKLTFFVGRKVSSEISQSKFRVSKVGGSWMDHKENMISHTQI